MLSALAFGLLSAAPLADGACERWKGTMWGNDPHVTTKMFLCRRGNELCGELDWKGKSGHNVRKLSGTVEDGVLVLKDTGFKLDAPQGGWRFCPIDRYTLKLKPGTKVLEGSYVSSACRDEAVLTLEQLPREGHLPVPSCFAAQ